MCIKKVMKRWVVKIILHFKFKGANTNGIYS